MGEWTINSEGVLEGYSGSASEITLPAGIVEIESNLFEKRKDIASVVIPEGVEEIGEWAFY